MPSATEAYTCGFCGGKESSFLYPTHDLKGEAFHLRKCHACKAFFLAPRPSHEALIQAYDRPYYGPTTEKFNARVIEYLLDHFRHRTARR